MFRKDPSPSRRRVRAGSRSSTPGAREAFAASKERDRRGRGRGDGRNGASGRFVLYVEGPRDREILEGWARRVEPTLQRCIERSTVILGGRQPARAVEDFARRGGDSGGWSGLVVLDRDHHAHSGSEEALARELGLSGEGAAGLELFVWGQRHIESYLLVPAAIRRVLGDDADDPRVEQALTKTRDGESVAADRTANGLHAKRVLGAGGSLSEALGQELRPGAIARAMRREDLHDDVHDLFGRIGRLAGVAARGPEIVVRAPREV